jgi:hypothetical protein
VPKNTPKNMTSEKMNQAIAQRNDASTLRLKSPRSLSPMTVPNQPKSMISRTPKPPVTSHGPTE